MKKLKSISITIFAILFLFLASSSSLLYAQELWTPTSTGANVPAGRHNHTAVWTGTKMIIWGGYAGHNLNTGGIYDPSADSWTATSITNAPSARTQNTTVWTGSVLGGKMIVWGGFGTTHLNTGGIYDPSTDTWTATSTINAPSPRYNLTAIWTGTKMIVWGGDNTNGHLNTGGIYDPSTDTWTATSTVNAPLGRENHTAVWTGTKMVVWGGYSGFNSLNTGGIYDPATDSWTATSTTNAPSIRFQHRTIWTGTALGGKMIVWGGSDISYLNTGGIYDPSTDTWTQTSTTNAPSARNIHTAIWTGSRMIVWGGYDGSIKFNTGGIYDPSNDTWSTTSTTNVPLGRYNHTAIWTGNKMIVWGGYDVNYSNSGGIYTNPAVIGIEKISNTVPTGFSLSQNYPNPFNPSTNIHFAIPKSAFVKITVFDILGREIETIVNERVNAGTYNANWDAGKFSSGVYFYKLVSGDIVITKKMLMVK